MIVEQTEGGAVIVASPPFAPDLYLSVVYGYYRRDTGRNYYSYRRQPRLRRWIVVRGTWPEEPDHVFDKVFSARTTYELAFADALRVARRYEKAYSVDHSGGRFQKNQENTL